MREVVVGARRIISEKLMEHQYREGYGRSLEGNRVEWDGDYNVEHMVGAGKTGNGRKCKNNVRLSESGEKEPKECVVER